jgi:hypothetical protein
VDGRQLDDFSLVDQPTIGLRLSGSGFQKPRVSAASNRNHAPRNCSFPGLGAKRRSDNMMQATLHALGWGATRLGVALALMVFAGLLTITIFVTVLVAIQAAAAFAQ